MVKLFVDDERNRPNKYWYPAKRFHEAIIYLERRNVSLLSLDHDLADENGTGYDICLWMIKNLPPAHWPGNIILHSSNPVGVANMQQLLATYKPTNCGLLVVSYDSNFDENVMKLINQ